MKSERRHELKENELAHMIDSARHFLAGRGKPLGMAVLAIAAVVVVGGLAIRTRAVAKEDRWRRLSQLTFADVETGKKSLEALIALTDSASDDNFVLTGLMDQGLQALRLSQKSQLPPDRELNEKAKRAFEQLVAKYPRNPIALGLAYSGLATVEENLFVLTGDPIHKTRAKKHLTAVIESDLLNGMPFQRLAIERRSKLDSTFADAPFVVSATDSDTSAATKPAKPAISMEEMYDKMPKEIRDQLPKEIREKIGKDVKPKDPSTAPVVIEPTKEAPSTDDSNKTGTDTPGGSDTP